MALGALQKLVPSGYITQTSLRARSPTFLDELPEPPPGRGLAPPIPSWPASLPQIPLSERSPQSCPAPLPQHSVPTYPFHSTYQAHAASPGWFTTSVPMKT